MKYFKPELLARSRSRDDDVADAAAQEWEEAITAYRTYLQGIHPKLPSGVRRLRARVTLHDAKLLAISFTRKWPWFSVLLRLGGTTARPDNLLELKYLLAAGVSFKRHPQFPQNGSGKEWILYDEFELDEQRGCFTHSLLLSSGHEVVVPFHNLRVRRLDEVLLAPLELPEGERTWPLVEA